MAKKKGEKKLTGLIWLVIMPYIAALLSVVGLMVIASVIIGRGDVFNFSKGEYGEMAGAFTGWVLGTLVAIFISLILHIVGLVKIAKVRDGEGEHSGLGTAGFVLGICGVPILALIFGAIAVGKKAKNRGMAVGSLVMGVSSMVAGVVVAIAVTIIAVVGAGAVVDEYYFDNSDGSRQVAAGNVDLALSIYADENDGQLPNDGIYVTRKVSGDGFTPYLVGVGGGVDKVEVNGSIFGEAYTVATEEIIEVMKGAECAREGKTSSETAKEAEESRNAAIFVKMSDGDYFCRNYTYDKD